MSTGRALKSHPPLYAEGGGAPNRPEGPTTGLGPRLVVRRSIVRRPREQVAQMHLDERGDLIHGDVSTELLGQRGHSGVGDAGVTSLSEELGRDVTVDEVAPLVEVHLRDLLAWASYDRTPDYEPRPEPGRRTFRSIGSAPSLGVEWRVWTPTPPPRHLPPPSDA